MIKRFIELTSATWDSPILIDVNEIKYLTKYIDSDKPNEVLGTAVQLSVATVPDVFSFAGEIKGSGHEPSIEGGGVVRLASSGVCVYVSEMLGVVKDLMRRAGVEFISKEES